MSEGNPWCQSVVLLEIPVADKWTRDEGKFLVTMNTIIIPPYHVSIILLKPIGHIVLWPSMVTEKRWNPFLSVEEPSIAILLLLQKVGDRLTDEFITVLWNQSGHTITWKRNSTIWHLREADYIEKPIVEWQHDTVEVTEISHTELLSMPENLHSCFTIPSVQNSR